MQQMNPQFPDQNSGTDALYDPIRGATNVGRRYYSIPGVKTGHMRFPTQLAQQNSGEKPYRFSLTNRHTE
jgi:hypothetical protein